MKKLYPLLSILLLFTCVFSQSPAIKWQKSLGGAGYDIGHSGKLTSDGGFIIAGTTDSTSGQVTGTHGSKDIWVIKLDSLGALQWQRALGGSGYDNCGTANSVQQTADGGYVVTGYTNSNDGDVTGNHGSYDYWVVKLSSLGAIQWQKTLGGPNSDQATSIQQTTDGGYIVAGESYSTTGQVTGNHGGGDYWLVKLDGSGNMQWQKSYGGSDWEVALDVKQTADGGYVVAGRSGSGDGDITNQRGTVDYWVVKTDSLGNMSWQNSYGGDSMEVAYSIAQTTDGGYIIAGLSESTPSGDVTSHHIWPLNAHIEDYWIVKISSTGALQWQESLGGQGQDVANSIQQTLDGGYIIGGYSTSADGDVTVAYHWGYYENWIVKLKPNGNIQWQRSLGGAANTGTDYDAAFSVQQLPDSTYLVTGVSNSNSGDVSGNHGKFDVSVFRLYKTPPPCLVYTIHNTGFDCNRLTDSTSLTLLTGTADSISWGDGIAYKLNGLPLSHEYAQPGIYRITLFDASECYAMEFDTLINAGVRIDTTLYINPTCSYSVMGAISIVASGGTPPYTYLWNTGATTSAVNNLTGGDYSVSVTDNTGCLSRMHYPLYKINGDTTYYIHLGLTYPNCVNNGVVYTTVNNGVPPYTYVWNNAHTTQNLTNIGQGYYAVTVTDSLGCVTSGDVHVDMSCRNFIYGHVYDDVNNNCTEDGGDLPMNHMAVTAYGNGGPFYGWIDHDGSYLVLVNDTGTYNLSFNYSYYGNCSNTVCAAPPPVVFTTMGDTSWNNNLGVQFTGYDLGICAGWGRVPPCVGYGWYQEWYWINLADASPVAVGGPVTVTFHYDSLLTPFEFSRFPNSINHTTRTITWIYNNIGTVGTDSFINVKFNYIAYNSSITQLSGDFSISPTAGDCDLTNNGFHFTDALFGSHDPNEKTVEPAGNITENDSVLTYTIHFQNNGLDTAWFITIKDTLSPYVEPASVRMLGSSIPQYDFNLNENGILTWFFNPALLPDSLVNPETSKGFIRYQVKKKKDLPIGTVISNRASIYFDYNDPVVTNTVSNMLVNPLGVAPVEAMNGISATAFPNPFSTETNILITGLNRDYDFELHDVTGKTIRNFKSVSTNVLQLKRNELSSGMYLYSISVKGNKLAYGKLVVE